MITNIITIIIPSDDPRILGSSRFFAVEDLIRETFSSVSVAIFLFLVEVFPFRGRVETEGIPVVLVPVRPRRGAHPSDRRKRAGTDRSVRREVLVIGREGEVGTDAAVGEDDGAALKHVKSVRRWRQRAQIGNRTVAGDGGGRRSGLRGLGRTAGGWAGFGGGVGFFREIVIGGGGGRWLPSGLAVRGGGCGGG